MKALAGTVLMLVATAAVAQERVTFSEFEAATQAAATRSGECRREVVRGPGERCERFWDYMDNRYEPLTIAFSELMEEEGIKAFEGASNVRLQMHRNRQSDITTNLNYITEMMQ